MNEIYDARDAELRLTLPGMMALRSHTTDPHERARLDRMIEKRLAEITPKLNIVMKGC